MQKLGAVRRALEAGELDGGMERLLYGELTAARREDTSWSKNAVITMLSRLEGKNAVRHEEGRRAKLYFPAVVREDAIEAETETFLDKVGGLGLLMRAMVEKNALTEHDIAELSAILEKAGGKT